MTVSDSRIEAIGVVETSDDDPFWTNTLALLDTIIAKQSVEVDAVAGATFSSKGIIEAVGNALTEASAGREDVIISDAEPVTAAETEPVETEPEPIETEPAPVETEPAPIETQPVPDTEAIRYKDGAYFGNGTGFNGNIQVAVMVTDGAISSVIVISKADDQEFWGKALGVIDDVIDAQSTDVDAVSGATYSSKGLLEAIADALKQAEG